ncbi:hypothetical protein BDZ89DRAFT_1116033 [Hymenopellis radicata]|nr:hypothetical protein BDZ89DRAFT_1116033 [Hymenopellis radicata]
MKQKVSGNAIYELSGVLALAPIAIESRVVDITTVVLSPEYVQNAVLDIHGLHHLDTIALYTGYLSTEKRDKALKTIACSSSLPNLRRLIILQNTELDDEDFSELHEALKTILDSSKYDLGGKIETIEIWDQQASSGEPDLLQRFAGCKVKDDGREWIPRTYSNFSVDEYSPPLEGATPGRAKASSDERLSSGCPLPVARI